MSKKRTFETARTNDPAAVKTEIAAKLRHDGYRRRDMQAKG